jgi:Phage tail lysozyme
MTNAPVPGKGGAGTYVPPTTGPVTPREIYQLLINAGASTIQAIGIMANMVYESNLNPESGGTDTNGYWAGGLISWNGVAYPNNRSLVTGNPQADVRAQVKYLFTSTNNIKQGLQGSTAQQVAENFARYVETCSTCQPGGQQYQARGAEAATVAGWVKSGNWPSSPGNPSLGAGAPSGGTTTATTTGAATGAGSACLVSAPSLSLPIVGKVAGGGCVFTKSNARAFLAAGLMVSGAVILGVGAILLASYGLRGTKTGQAVAGAVAATPGVGAAAEVVARRLPARQPPARTAPSRPRRTRQTVTTAS